MLAWWYSGVASTGRNTLGGAAIGGKNGPQFRKVIQSLQLHIGKRVCLSLEI